MCLFLLYSGQNGFSQEEQSFSFTLDTLVDSKSETDIIHIACFLFGSYTYFQLPKFWDLCNHVVSKILRIWVFCFEPCCYLGLLLRHMPSPEAPGHPTASARTQRCDAVPRGGQQFMRWFLLVPTFHHQKSFWFRCDNWPEIYWIFYSYHIFLNHPFIHLFKSIYFSVSQCPTGPPCN